MTFVRGVVVVSLIEPSRESKWIGNVSGGEVSAESSAWHAPAPRSRSCFRRPRPGLAGALRIERGAEVFDARIAHHGDDGGVGAQPLRQAEGGDEVGAGR